MAYDHVFDHDDERGNSRSLLRKEMFPDLSAMDLPSDRDKPADQQEFDDGEIYTFYDKIAKGYGVWEAGMSTPLGWSRAQIERFVGDKDRADLLSPSRNARTTRSSGRSCAPLRAATRRRRSCGRSTRCSTAAGLTAAT